MHTIYQIHICYFGTAFRKPFYWTWLNSFYYISHCVPKMLKSKPRGASPKFIWQMKEGYMVIWKYKTFFKSVEGNFWHFSEKIWTGFPRALPPGIRMKLEDKKFKCGNPSLHCYFWAGFLALKAILVESSIIYNWL